MYWSPAKSRRKCARRSGRRDTGLSPATSRSAAGDTRSGTYRGTFFLYSTGTARSRPPIHTHTHTQAGRWDLIIAHPPCTDLAVSGARHFAQKQKDGRQQKSIVFFMQMALAWCDRIAVENPVCIMSSAWRKPDQIIQPYMFGEHARKTTCLWLKGLPPLEATDIVDPGEIVGKGFSVGASLDMARDENGKIISWNDPRTAKIRSKTFPGIAKAMAEQWG